MTPCENRLQDLLLRAYGELGAPSGSELERHIEDCPGCRTHLEEVADLQEAAREEIEVLDRGAPAPRMAHAHAVQHFEQSMRPGWRGWLSWLAIPALATVVLMAGAPFEAPPPSYTWDAPGVEAQLRQIEEHLDELDALVSTAGLDERVSPLLELFTTVEKAERMELVPAVSEEDLESPGIESEALSEPISGYRNRLDEDMWELHERLEELAEEMERGVL